MKKLKLEVLFFIVVGISSIIYSLYQFLSLYLNKDKIEYTLATILDTKTVAPEAMKKNNSRWAIVSLVVDGKEYVSSKRIQVEMNATIGEQIKVAYFKHDPSEIFTPNLKKAGVFLAISVVSFLLIMYFNK